MELVSFTYEQKDIPSELVKGFNSDQDYVEAEDILVDVTMLTKKSIDIVAIIPIPCSWYDGNYGKGEANSIDKVWFH